MDLFCHARRIAHDYYPGAVEIGLPTETMYELDAVVGEDGQVAVTIMYDESTNEYALVEARYEDIAIANTIELEARRADFIHKIELKTMMAFGTCQTAEDAAACWAALDSTISQTARLRIKELGGDPDIIVEKLDRFFLTHPDC